MGTIDKLKDLNTWTNHILDILFHVTLIGIAFHTFSPGFFRVIAIIYVAFLVASLITPSHTMKKWG